MQKAATSEEKPIAVGAQHVYYLGVAGRATPASALPATGEPIQRLRLCGYGETQHSHRGIGGSRRVVLAQSLSNPRYFSQSVMLWSNWSSSCSAIRA